MNNTDKKLKKLARRQHHFEELQKMGYTGETLIPLKRIENEAHRAVEQYANGDIDEVRYSDTEMRLSNRVAVLFGGTLPKGFFINGDPRGYALKIDDEVVGRDNMPISYTDFGGYGILAPEDL